MSIHTVWLLCELSFSTAAENTVLVLVELDCNWFSSPWNKCTVGDASSQFKRGACVHFWDNLTANWAVWICWVDLTTRWQIAVSAVDEFDEPMCCIHINEIDDVGCLSSQRGVVSVPKHTVSLVRRDFVVVQSGCSQGRAVVNVAPVTEGSISVVDG